jgi:demethylmenaquinone methyltransferase/2-methoxy-6-polyprenyl-1,4-benzoquinol methylase
VGDRQAAYAADAPTYDARTSPFHPWRQQLVELLPLRAGDVVLDVGCGTGLCFSLLQDGVGPHGVIAGIDESPEMLALAAERVAEHGWHNVVLVEAAAERAVLPVTADHALFCAVHDVLQSPAALANILGHVRPGGSVAAGGGKYGPPWNVAFNMMIMSLHAPFVREFDGFDRPWELLARYLVDLGIDDVAMGGGYVALGRIPA